MVNFAVEHHVFVDLVGQDHDVGVAGQGGQAFDVVLVKHRAGRVVRRVDDDHARFAVDGGGHFVPVDAKILQRQFDRHRRGALQAHDRRIAVERRFEIDHLVAGMHQRADRRVQPFAGAGDHRDFFVGVIACAIQSFSFSARAARNAATPLIGAYWL